MTNILIKRIIDIKTKEAKEAGRELITSEWGSHTKTICRDNWEIVDKEYVYCGGEVSEVERGRYSPRDDYYKMLNEMLLEAGM
ncbi:Uncharacterised protein [uncultured archaeon]|nr:Uncharacterised protein [uncultured archaeon]